MRLGLSRLSGVLVYAWGGNASVVVVEKKGGWFGVWEWKCGGEEGVLAKNVVFLAMSLIFCHGQLVVAKKKM